MEEALAKAVEGFEDNTGEVVTEELELKNYQPARKTCKDKERIFYPKL